MSPIDELAKGTRLQCIESFMYDTNGYYDDLAVSGDIFSYLAPYNMTWSWLSPEDDDGQPFIIPNETIRNHFTFAPMATSRS